MCLGRSWLGALAVSAASLGVGSDAFGLSFAEFDRLRDYQQENFIQTALHFYYYGYKNDPVTAYKASCMTGLNDKTVEGGKSYLWLLIADDLNTARVSAGKRESVEGVIKAIIERECKPQ